jgi:hypothetical protein
MKDPTDALRESIIARTLPPSVSAGSKEKTAEGSPAAGDLLSESLKRREEMDKRDEENANQLRENFVKEVRTDIIGNMIRRRR